MNLGHAELKLPRIRINLLCVLHTRKVSCSACKQRTAHANQGRSTAAPPAGRRERSPAAPASSPQPTFRLMNLGHAELRLPRIRIKLLCVLYTRKVSCSACKQRTAHANQGRSTAAPPAGRRERSPAAPASSPQPTFRLMNLGHAELRLPRIRIKLLCMLYTRKVSCSACKQRTAHANKGRRTAVPPAGRRERSPAAPAGSPQPMSRPTRTGACQSKAQT